MGQLPERRSARGRGALRLCITTDKNLRYQQDLRCRTLAIQVLPTMNWPEIQIHGNEVAEAASRMTAGRYLEIHW